jgi:hypothetical protein
MPLSLLSLSTLLSVLSCTLPCSAVLPGGPGKPFSLIIDNRIDSPVKQPNTLHSILVKSCTGSPLRQAVFAVSTGAVMLMALACLALFVVLAVQNPQLALKKLGLSPEPKHVLPTDTTSGEHEEPATILDSELFKNTVETMVFTVVACLFTLGVLVGTVVLQVRPEYRKLE